MSNALTEAVAGPVSRATLSVMTRQILVVGSLNMDLIVRSPRIPVPGETIAGHGYFEAPGGKGANQAFACARLGGRVAMLGRVGADAFGARLTGNLAAAGCAVEGIAADASTHTGLALIVIAADGQNSIILVPGANEGLLPEHLERQWPAFQSAGIVLLQLEIPLETAQSAVRLARRAGARVVLDPAPARALPGELLPSVDILTPNESEAALLTGRVPGPLALADAEAMGRELLARGPSTVVLKMGASGCLLMTAGSRTGLHVPAPQVSAIDTTAAGDVFNAAMAVGLSEGLDLLPACRFAQRAAALSVTRLGAQTSVPSREEVERWTE